MQPHARTRLLFLWSGLLLLLLAPPLAADTCDGCPKPTTEQIKKIIGDKLKTRSGSKDRIYMDKGDCIAGVEGAPEVQPIKFWLREIASGEVWNCPHSKSHDTITIEAHAADKTEWTLQASGGFKLKGLVAEVEAKLTRGETSGVTITEVIKVSKTLVPNFCKRIQWEGYFLAGRFKATATIRIKQEWAWWTKNPTTRYKVHEKGTVTVDCGTQDIEFQRNAPLAGYFHLTEGSCEDAGCSGALSKKLGFFPKLPPEVEPPEKPKPAPEPEEAPEDEPEFGDAEDPDALPPEEEPDSSDDLGDAPTGPLDDPLAGAGS